jgi:hypothetical protein
MTGPETVMRITRTCWVRRSRGGEIVAVVHHRKHWLVMTHTDDIICDSFDAAMAALQGDL